MSAERSEPAAGVLVREMTESDVPAVLELWREAPGVTLTRSDDAGGLVRCLRRNPGLALVAEEAGRLVGAVLGGHDGRRGYVHHLAVAPDRRGRALGRRLTEACLARLRKAGIEKAHGFIERDNAAGRGFFRALGWAERTDLVMVSKRLDDPGA